MEQGTPLVCRECGECHSELVMPPGNSPGAVHLVFRRVAGPCPDCGEKGEMIEAMIGGDNRKDDFVYGCRACLEREGMGDVDESEQREWVDFLRRMVYPRLYRCSARPRKASRRWLVGKKRG